VFAAGDVVTGPSTVISSMAEGRQAYVVYPRVEEADLPAGIKAVTQEYERLQQVFAPYRLGLLHGQLARRTRSA
jgi:ATP-dependent DNA helicase RecG